METSGMLNTAVLPWLTSQTITGSRWLDTLEMPEIPQGEPVLSVTTECHLPRMTETMTIMTQTAPCGQMEAGGTVVVKIAA